MKRLMLIITLVLALSMSIAVVSAATGDSFIIEQAPNYRLTTPHYMSWMSPEFDKYAIYGPGLYYDQGYTHFSKVKPTETEYLNNAVLTRYFDQKACRYTQNNAQRGFDPWLTFEIYCPGAQQRLSMLRSPVYEQNELVYVGDYVLGARYR